MRLFSIGTPGPSMEQTLNPPHRSAIALTALAYIPSVLCMMPVGVLVPFIDALSRDLATTAPQLGLAIALFSVPSAILATLGGGLIDRYGVRRSLLLAAAALILGSVLVSQVHSLLALDCAMVVSGTKKARAISVVVSPPIRRSVRAT